MNIMERIGPQAASDDAATRRHRFHQSWFRTVVLELPFGTGPRPLDTSLRGSMLTREDGAAGRNFLSAPIAATAEARIARGGTVEPFRCRQNMLSSQPMCFNLFGQMIANTHLAAALVQRATGRPVERIIRIELEDSGDKRLGDATGMDASVRYLTTDGETGILAIETKLTEQFSPKVYAMGSRPKYAEFTYRDGSCFNPDNADQLSDSKWNQLWRNQMLAEAVAVGEELDHAEQLVIFPSDAGKTAGLVDQYASLLWRARAVVPMTLDEVLSTMKTSAGPDDQVWLADFNTRYVDLDRSAEWFERSNA